MSNKTLFLKKIKSFVLFIMSMMGLPFLFRKFFLKDKNIILYYHSPSPQILRMHLLYLINRFNIISLEQLVNAIKQKDWSSIPAHSLVITIDDGLRENHELVDIFKEFNVPVTIYLCSHIIDTKRHYWFSAGYPDHHQLKDHPNQERLKILKKAVGFDQEKEYDQPQALNLDQISRMSSYVDFQSHGRYHAFLPSCTDQESLDEIKGSKQLLEQLLSRKVLHFSYPHGGYTDREMKYLSNAGYISGVTTDEGVNDQTSDCFCLKRTWLADDASIRELDERTNPILLYFKWLIRSVKKR